MISAETHALVAGGGLRATAPPARLVMVRVLRAFLLAGRRIDPGAEIELDKSLAAELVSAGKVERITARPAADAPAPEASKPRKEPPRAQQ